MGYCCADCVYMDKNDENSYGDFWCGKHRKYYPGGDNTCSDFEPRSGNTNGGCYITTAICISLGKLDNCYELNTFRNFRDKWLRNQPDGEQLISDYYAVAPSIVQEINNLPNAQEIYNSIWHKYLKTCLYLIEIGNNDKAKSLYTTMVVNLKKNYLRTS